MSIDLICPSRGRPDAAKALRSSFTVTAMLPSTRLVFALDADDPTAKDYPEPQVIGAPTGDPTGPLNAAALASSASILGFIGDDSRCATKGWDVQVEALLREPGIAWGDDGHDKPWPSTCFISREIVQALGFMALPALKRGFFDCFWIDLAMQTGGPKIIQAKFPHHNADHPVAPEVIAADEAAYQRWREGDIHGDVHKVKTAIDLAHFFPPTLVNV